MAKNEEQPRDRIGRYAEKPNRPQTGANDNSPLPYEEEQPVERITTLLADYLPSVCVRVHRPLGRW